MAKAITQIEKQPLNPEQEQDKQLRELLGVIGGNTEAVTSFVNVIKELHSVGIFDIVQAFLVNRNQIGFQVINQLNQPGIFRIAKNAMGLFQLLSNLDPSKTQRLLNSVARGVEGAGNPEAETPHGLWGLAKEMRDPDVLRAVGTMMNFLREMGKQLVTEQHFDR